MKLLNKMFRDHFNVPDFETVKIPDKAYVELYNQTMRYGLGRHNLQVDVDKYILIVKLYATISMDSLYVTVLDVQMIDENCAGIDDENCAGIDNDFDVDGFEEMFT